MVKDLCTMLYGEVLSPASRAQLLTWMLACEPGASRLPAGVPLGWRVAHRTGTRTLDPGHAPAERAAYGDVGILIPPHGAPIAIAAYVAGTDWPMAAVEAWFAGLAREVAAER
jgi:beta-lactamase class A